MTCAQCGTPFSDGRRRLRFVYCSAACGKAARAAQREEAREQRRRERASILKATGVPPRSRRERALLGWERRREQLGAETQQWSVQEARRRFLARQKLNDALRDGRMTRGACAVCGTTEEVEGHHEDYSRPLAVVWLCRPHHRARHANRNATVTEARDEKTAAQAATGAAANERQNTLTEQHLHDPHHLPLSGSC